MRKLMIVGPYPLPGRAISGGVERVIEALLPKLQSEYCVKVVVPSVELPSRLGSDHSPTIVYLRKLIRPGWFWYWIVDGLRIWLQARSFAPDIIHYQGACGYFVPYGCKKVVTVHGIPAKNVSNSAAGLKSGRVLRAFSSKFVQAVERLGRSAVHGYIEISPYVSREMPDLAGKHHVALPNPVSDVFRLAPINDAGGRQDLIVVVGRLSANKRTLELIEIFSKIAGEHQSYKFLFAGEAENTEYMKSVSKRIAEGGLLESIIVRGNCSANELVDILGRARLLVHFSHQETAPMAISEALCCGVPVVSIDKFGISDMLRQGENGIKCWDTEEALKSGILKGMRMDWDHAQIAMEARAMYSAARISAECCRFLETVCDGQNVDRSC